VGGRRAKSDAFGGYALGSSQTRSFVAGNVSGFMDWKATYSEFSSPRLVEIYNTVNPVGGHKDFFLNMASVLSAESIIDLGCGSDLLSCELSEAGHQVIGVEPSASMLELARNSLCSDQVEWINGVPENSDHCERTW
jgi:2-polyprenyl-3-methyl-5-hydroxy-6-metoxy-1,4-benzoquinol methylase